MCRSEEFHLGVSPDTDSKAEVFRLSLLDFVVPPNYNTYAIIFQDHGAGHDRVIEIFQRGLELTVQQCRHLVGTIEKNEFGDYSIIRTAKSSVRFAVRWHNDEVPSIADLQKKHFTLAGMGDHTVLQLDGMPDSQHPDDHPAVIGFQLNFIRGGFILTTHVHHLALDMTGTTNVIQQLALNCRCIANNTDAPVWDKTLMDRSRFYGPDIEGELDAPPRPYRHKEWKACSWLLFHLPPRNAARLKSLAVNPNGSGISTYDATTAFCWRIVARNRAKIYDMDLSAPAIFGQPMNLRSRVTPPVPSNYQGNALGAGLSFQQESPLTLEQVVSSAGLSEIAAFIRTITNSVGQKNLDEAMERVAPFRKKSDLDMPLDSLPPSSFTTTDWRSAKLADNDFGIGEAVAYRCLYNRTVENMMVLYPPHKAVEQEGIEVMIPFESHSINVLLEDADLKEYFEFRGVEVS